MVSRYHLVPCRPPIQQLFPMIELNMELPQLSLRELINHRMAHLMAMVEIHLSIRKVCHGHQVPTRFRHRIHTALPTFHPQDKTKHTRSSTEMLSNTLNILLSILQCSTTRSSPHQCKLLLPLRQTMDMQCLLRDMSTDSLHHMTVDIAEAQ